MFRLVENSWVLHDSEAWCAAFVGACLELAGYRSTRSLSARSYAKWGEALSQPEPGCVAVLWRLPKGSNNGHVGFFLREEGDQIVLLGGNQSDSVSEQSYPKDRLLAYRRPEGKLIGPAFSPLIRNIAQIAPADEPALAAMMPAIADEPEIDERGVLADVEDPAAMLPTAEDPAPAVKVLARPMMGEDVRDLQEKLRMLGYPVGTIDGEFGPMTEAAVFEFQSANNLPANGIADGPTLAALIGGQGPKLDPARVRVSEDELLQMGSRILQDARSGRWAAVAAGVLGLFGFSDANLDILQSISNLLKGGALNPATGDITTPAAPPAGNTLLQGLSDYLPQILGVKGGVWAGLLGAGVMAWRYFNKAAKDRVADHASGVNRGK